MLYRIFYLLLIVPLFVFSSNIHDHLRIDYSHVKSNVGYIDAAFLVRLEPHENLQYLFQDFQKRGIVLNEYNKFNKIPNPLLCEFCSSIMSPYLLTQILSHLSIYKYCLKNNIEKALVVENKAFIKGDLKKLQSVIEKLEKRHASWDIIYTDVDYHHPATGQFIVPVLQEIPSNKRRIDQNLSRVFCRYGTVSFIISKSGMKKILEYFRHHWHDLPYDQILFKIPKLIICGVHEDIITNQYEVKTQQDIEKEKRPLITERPFYQTHDSFWIRPIELLTYDRFDVMAKYIYAKYKLKHYATNWHLNLYKSHLEKWIQFYNTEPLKIGFQDFKFTFHTLINSLYQYGFDEHFPIPVNNLGLACDGSHRTGASLALGNIPVKVTVQEGKGSPNMLAEAFRKKYHLEEKYLDHMAYEYAKLKENTFIVCLFPYGYQFLKEAEKILQKYGIIVHYKDIWFSESGYLEFVRLAYTGEWWTGSYLDEFKHSQAKANLCFPEALKKKYPVRVYLYECSEKKVTRQAKEEIRQFCRQNNEAVHINDNHQQTKIIAAGVFNQNSIDFLNHKKLNLHKNFYQLLEKLKDFIIESKIDPETICIDTGSVLSAYGLRDCNDLDILHRYPLPKTFKKYGIDSHNAHLHHHIKKLDEIIFNPENHFYYQGIKFVKLDLVEQMKSDRNSEKDRRDIRLMQLVK